jgi:hypothetical protein
LGARVAATDANTDFATPHLQGRRREVQDAPSPVLARCCEIAHAGDRIAPVFGTYIVVITPDVREGARPVPGAGVIGAYVVVFTNHAVAKVLGAAEAPSTRARDVGEGALRPVVRRFMCTPGAALACATQVDDVLTVVAGAEVAVVAI